MSTITVEPALTVVNGNPPPPGPDKVLDAMRDLQTESGLWNLADALYFLIPSGEKGFDQLIDKATAAGVVGRLSKNTLRLYRDTAARWPADERVANVSFSAHREAQVLPRAQAVKMLGDLSQNLGAGKVTVASVRKAIAVQKGTVPSTPVTANGTAPAAPAASQTHLRVLNDIKAGSPALIAAIVPTTTSTELDSLHAGLNKALAHVEQLRIKAAARAKAPTPTTRAKKPTPTKRTTTKASAPATTEAQPDLRDM